jgi:hypothetical protein
MSKTEICGECGDIYDPDDDNLKTQANDPLNFCCRECEIKWETSRADLYADTSREAKVRKRRR